MDSKNQEDCIAPSRRRFLKQAGSVAIASLPLPPLRRFLPPRRPRRRPFLSVPAAAGVFNELSAACWISLVTATEDSSASGFCSNGNSGSGDETVGGVRANSPVAGVPASSGISPGAPPRRTAASCALVFQSERRNLSAAAEYHFAASAFCPEVSKNFASSNATMASRVFW